MLVTDGKIPTGTPSPYAPELLSATQWATSGLLGAYIDKAVNETVTLDNPLGINSMEDLEMNWVESPEFTTNTTFTVA